MLVVSKMLSSSIFYFLYSIVSKGVSANMLKVSSKRRRTQAEIKADKEAAAKKEAEAAAS